MTRRVYARALGVLAGLSLVSGVSVVSAGAASKEPTIGVTVYSMTSWVSWGKQGVLAEAKAKHVHLEWLSANNSVSTQISQMQTFVEQHVSAILVAAVNSATLGPEIRQAEQAGIPVFGVNMRLFPPTNRLLKAYVGPNDVLAGAHEMAYLAGLLHGKGNIVVAQGPIGQSAEMDRTAGIQSVLKKYPGIHLLSMMPANWSRTQAETLMENWISRYGHKIDGYVAENDDMAIGGIRALLAAHMHIPVVGIDGIKDGMRAIMAGTEKMSNLQDAALEMGEGLDVVVRYLQHRPYPRLAMINMPILTKKDVRHYYDQIYVHPGKFLQDLPALIRHDINAHRYNYQ